MLSRIKDALIFAGACVLAGLLIPVFFVLAIPIGLAAVFKERSEKCQFYDVCDYKQDDHYTCNHDDDACTHCGKYRENQWR